MLARVAWRSLSSASIFSVVSFALATWHSQRAAVFSFVLAYTPWVRPGTAGGRWLRKNTHRFGFERLNRLDVCAHVVRDGFEVAEDLLSLVNDGLVAEDSAVVLEVNGRGLRSELRLNALGVAVPLAECLEGRNGLCRVSEYELPSTPRPPPCDPPQSPRIQL